MDTNLSIDSFCEEQGFSRDFFDKLLTRGFGPRLTLLGQRLIAECERREREAVGRRAPIADMTQTNGARATGPSADVGASAGGLPQGAAKRQPALIHAVLGLAYDARSPRTLPL